jgi:hypothetical protein
MAATWTNGPDASVMRIAVQERDDHLHLSIRDDGVGGADPARGSGLIGLRDRGGPGQIARDQQPSWPRDANWCPAPVAAPLTLARAPARRGGRRASGTPQATRQAERSPAGSPVHDLLLIRRHGVTDLAAITAGGCHLPLLIGVLRFLLAGSRVGRWPRRHRRTWPRSWTVCGANLSKPQMWKEARQRTMAEVAGRRPARNSHNLGNA